MRISEIQEFVNAFDYKDGEIDNPHKAVFFLGEDVFDKDGNYAGKIAAVLKTKVEVYTIDEDHKLIDYPVYFGIVWNKRGNNE